MAVRFSDDQVTKATGGKKLRPGSRACYEAVCTDSRRLVPGCLFLPLEGEKFDGHDFLAAAAAGGAKAVLVKKGRQLPELPQDVAVFEVEDTLRALGGLGQFHRLRFSIPVGAVTGSNGKTTTKEMAASILRTRGRAHATEGNLNNEVGVPLTLFGLSHGHVAAVVELGMNHPGEIARLANIVQPDAGLITAVQPAHLHGLSSLEGVAEAKGELFLALRSKATAVVNLDDPLVLEQAIKSGAPSLGFGRAQSAEVRLSQVEGRGREGMLAVIVHTGKEHPVRLSFLGAHNALNATGAFALGLALGYSPEECVRGLEAARPYERRLRLIEAPGGYSVLDDCYNANPASVRAAIETLSSLAGSGRALAVLGDMLELGPSEAEQHRSLGEEVSRAAKLVAFFGPRSAGGHQAAGMGERAAHFTEIQPLLDWLSPKLCKGDVVLVKGSRGMRLERVVEALCGQASSGAP
ncbi:MAG: UDP-N-acetylmuramoyl-tripeptide--D-alanyl-D-alanine ligase [Myxococcales bacterium]|nr:UDP-N-acetylmuramoyl-tripeptide--D-alanyl-D-alanine ligase [Myxococcales bacterium]